VIALLEVFAVCGVALTLGLLADHTNIGSGLAATVRGALPTERTER
jgi:hypothetical protein